MFNTVDDSTKPQPSGATTEDAGITHNSNHAEFDELESLPGGANHGPTTNGQTSIYEGLRECEVYHGQLPEEDLVTMLHTDGDYILTLLQTEIKRAVVVWVKGNDAIKYLDFVIKIEPKSCSLDGITFRPTIVEIIAFHTIHGTPISSSDSTCIKLVRGVKRQSWELDAKNVITGKLLGEGAFGQVFLGMMFDDEKQIKVAIKVPRENPGKEKDVIKQAMNEARIQRRYCHQNIVRLYGVILNTKPFSIIMEYVDGGNLESHLKKTPLLMDTKMTYCFDVAMGMQYLHALSCLHRDMATRNCLVDNTYPCIKISDFGLSANGTSIAMDRSKPAPVRWMAPEVLKTAKYEAPADIWSMGVLFWEIYTSCKELPYSKMDLKQVQAELMTNPNFHPDYDKNTTPGELKDLFEIIWNHDPNARPKAKDVVEHLGAYSMRDRYPSDLPIHRELSKIEGAVASKQKPNNPTPKNDPTPRGKKTPKPSTPQTTKMKELGREMKAKCDMSKRRTMSKKPKGKKGDQNKRAPR